MLSYTSIANVNLPFANKSNNGNMDDKEKRLKKLRKLVDKAGGRAEFARIYSRDDADKPIDPTYVSQLLNRHRPFGENAARNMEKRAGFPEGYFDSDIDDPNMEVFATSNEELKAMMRILMKLPKSSHPYAKRSIDVVAELSTKEGSKKEAEGKKENRDSNK